MSIDLSTNYGGLQLSSPIVVGACPLTADEQTRVALVSAGAGAIVLPSLFEEQVIRWSQKIGRTLTQREQDMLGSADLTQAENSGHDAEAYLAAVNRSSSQLSVPVIASLNGFAIGGWVDFAGELQEAGAHGIELNIYPPLPKLHNGPRAIEDEIVELVREVDAAITIPLFIKLGRDYTSLPHLACRLLSGVQGLVLFGRSPDVDICLDTLKLNTNWGLTAPGLITQSLARIMQVHAYCPAMSIAACGGIGTPEHVVKALLAGADVAMVTSAVYRDGPDVLRILTDGLREFMNKHRLTSIRELQLQRPLEFAKEEDRAAYMAALTARFKAEQTHNRAGTSHGDKYGHPSTLRD